MDNASLSNVTHPKSSQLPESIPMIWTGYTKNGRHYVDMRPKALDAETQLCSLLSYYEQHFSGKDQFWLRWIKCQKPVVQIGDIKTADFHTNDPLVYPREVLFTHLRRESGLTAGFSRPELLRDDASYFFEDTAFDAIPTAMFKDRKILCIGHEIDKRYLIWPLIFSFAMAVVAAVVTGVMSESVASGTEAGGFIGLAVVLSWSYVLWLLG
ncbi:hypothetical protein DE146DRAFT_467783 [Phaeosphaeria sp. MPI-PUGE-AT-0046c]|nr:hypothetical protein DE146DRAFT_467783 [Phaeosphaeria sp. MPI-PUGE-AT-0046c]